MRSFRLAAAALLLAGCGAPSDFRSDATLEPTPGTQEPSTASPCRYLDRSGEVAIGPELEITDGFEFQEGLAGVRNRAGRLGYIDKRGRVVVPFQYQDGTSHREGRAGVLADGMCGFIDRRGELVVPRRYDEVTNFRDGWGLVRRGRRYTFVDLQGEEMGRGFAAAESFSEELAAVAPQPAEAGGTGHRWGYVDTDGVLVIEPRFAKAEPFSEGLAAVLIEGKWGYVDARGHLAIAPRFDRAGPFSEGVAPVQTGSKMGYVDPTGALVIEPRFEADRFQSDPDEKPVFVGRFVDGLAAVRYAKGPEARAGWGFIDRAGQFVTPPVYEDAYMFSEGLARVRLDGRWGFVDRTGAMVIPARYGKVGDFSEGLALACD